LLLKTAVSENKSESPDDARPKRFRIARKRLGTIRFVDPNGEFGFIVAEDFRDDVFFHRTVWEGESPSGQKTGGVLRGFSPRSRDRNERSDRDRNERSDRDRRPPRSSPRPPASASLSEELVGRHVEFEIDDEIFENEKRLRAAAVRPTKRPMGRKLSGRDATFKIVTHHPKARRKRPDWRK
jgi:hypothetical protein